MTDRIDHAAEACAHLTDVNAYENDAHSYRLSDESDRAAQALAHAGLSAQQAQVHAALALVEQQRIANLIALGRMTDNSEWLPVADARHALVEVRPFVYQSWDGTKCEDEHEVLRPDIAAALGIEVGCDE